MNIFELSFLDPIEDFFVALLSHQIYLAPIGLLIIEESGIPIPIPGEIIIAYIGYEVSKGIIPYFVAFIMILCSILMGATILYFLSYRYGEHILLRFGKQFHVNREKLFTVEKYFKKYGPLVIIFGRHIPGFRIPVTIFSGMSKVGYRTFIVSTFISVIFWIVFYLELGKQLGPQIINLLKAHHVYYFFFFAVILVIAVYVMFLRFKNRTLNKKSQ